ncbi:aspartate carbamoyltransferase catalytic subunit [Companilactobacillus sp.]|jgi:aspartate carbamoyltransferase catalytic subunit|uniref:aspartate carbamoyltransferase catalytic subunit n=1 Tax=Companilactobacillus sp. TaxID=2767905 RepID=UPI0025C4ECFF|nr:aspartate carbamoyltransferase catalytic subunit [Companilactobacillus sp.]MCH4008376.1 aspartate carbamoyltransferase catalytic subunit [Companilactobacillus sp.]MCH4051445.1 aspartate carbamoyltransferase catalytic subunit [Companilactobacillus sp.]MCH4076319.1 aspartate carbamoyltransferase catalytic subunit [Companilactobacillus sp.]MCH4124894.1 aspartate carbamoyltransferase catalytic subunit [Companilactobacillus sp.]MCH4131436.1 aspartate carbamoyltransferase catalytic subunit [Compa
MKNILSMSQFSNQEVYDLIDRAIEFKEGKTSNVGMDKYAMNLFFENSTRTKSSFQVAEMNLGMREIAFEAGSSSTTKGETLYDTVKTIESIGASVAVIRHSQDEFYNQLLNRNINIPIINAGDGTGQHPSQSLLDMMTIFEHFGQFEGLKIGIIGDLTHSRVAHSNAEILTRLGAEVSFGGLDSWYTNEFAEIGPHMSVDDLCSEMDVVMLLRVQHERLSADENKNFSKEDYFQQYGLDMRRVDMMKEDAMIMHPAPVNRGVEIADDVVECDKSYIFKQMQNGVFMRMAMIEAVLQGENSTDELINQKRQIILR